MNIIFLRLKMLARTIFVATLVLGAIAFQKTLPAAELIPIAGDQIQALIEGSTVVMTSKSGHPMTWTFHPGGKLDGTIEVDAHDIRRDRGRWWSNRRGGLCFEWEKWLSAEKRCPALAFEDGKIRLLRRNGSPGRWLWRIKQAGPAAGPVLQIARAGPSSKNVRGSGVPTGNIPGDASRIPGDLIKSLMSETQVTTVSARGYPLTARFQADGRMVGEIDAPFNTIVDEGKWWTTKVGTLCFQWKRFAKGAQYCSIVFTTGDTLFRLHPVTGLQVGKSWKIKSTGPGFESVIAAVKTGTARQVAAVSPDDITLGAFSQLHFGNYHAVVIGNNGYRHLEKLKSARNDADMVAQTLTGEYGFKVTKLVDATRSQILGTLAKMRATLKPDDNLLIYYAGHGIVDSVTEQGYWLPVDAEQENPANWISNTDVTNMLRAIRARHVMVVADSCYSGTLVRASSAKMQTSRNKVAWVKRMLGKRGRTALVSGGLEPVVDSGTGSGHSVFAQAFLKALQENRDVLEGHALFDLIKRPVVLNANQTPQYSDIRLAGHEGGEFVFVRKQVLRR